MKTRVGIAVCALAATCGLGPIAAQSPVQQPAAAANPPVASASGFEEELIVAVPLGSELKGWTARENHVAWMEGKAGAWIVRFDGKQQGGAFEDILMIAMSPDGAHLHFIGKRNGMEVHVVDGQDRSPEYTSFKNLVFQPHGDSIAYSACTEKKKCRLFVDEKPQGAEYEDISRPLYSSDGKRLAYFAKRDKIWIAIVDGKQTGPDLETFGYWGFSDDASHFTALPGSRARKSGPILWTALRGQALKQSARSPFQATPNTLRTAAPMRIPDSRNRKRPAQSFWMGSRWPAMRGRVLPEPGRRWQARPSQWPPDRATSIQTSTASRILGSTQMEISSTQPAVTRATSW